MIIRFECPHCQTRLEVDADAGPEAMCAICRRMVRVPPPHIAPGTEIGGYRLVRRIGRGGMAEVYLAEQVSLGRVAAVKILHPALARDRAFVQRFLREMRLVARLEHPNIVRAFGAGEDTGFYYLAMAYVDGRTLEQLIRSGPLSELEVLHWARQVAIALDYAWREHRLIHRDLKPTNLMIQNERDVRVMDFGVARCLDDAHGAITRTGLIVGTPNYMSPEALGGSPQLDFRTDVYSLGATMYHALTRQLPYEGRNFAETVRRRHVRPWLPHPHDANPALSEPCVALLERLLDPVPERRSSSWADTAEDIERVIRGEMPRAAEAAPQAAKRRSRRHYLRHTPFATHVLSRRRRVVLSTLFAIAAGLLVLDVWLVFRVWRRWRSTPAEGRQNPRAWPSPPSDGRGG